MVEPEPGPLAASTVVSDPGSSHSSPHARARNPRLAATTASDLNRAFVMRRLPSQGSGHDVRDATPHVSNARNQGPCGATTVSSPTRLLSTRSHRHREVMPLSWEAHPHLTVLEAERIPRRGALARARGPGRE